MNVKAYELAMQLMYEGMWPIFYPVEDGGLKCIYLDAEHLKLEPHLLHEDDEYRHSFILRMMHGLVAEGVVDNARWESEQ